MMCACGHIEANIASFRHEVAQHHFERSEKHHVATGDASLYRPQISRKALQSPQFYAILIAERRCGYSESGGTAYSTFKNYPVKVAAKTGTAQTGVNNHSDHGAFVCYAPADDPQIAVVVYGERAGHGRSLGDVAKQVLDAYFGFGQYGDIVTPENGIS